MNREDIIKKITATLSEEFEVPQEVIVPEASLYATLQLDSLTALEMLSIVYYTFKVKIPAQDLPQLKTFNDLYDYIASHAL